MELLLGLPPMSQYDAVATPILDFDTAPNNGCGLRGADAQQPGHADRPHQGQEHPLYKLALMTQGMDFTQEDKAPAQLLNQVIWQSVKGVGTTVPALHHSPIIARLTGIKAVKGKAGTKAAVKTVARDGDD